VFSLLTILLHSKRKERVNRKYFWSQISLIYFNIFAETLKAEHSQNNIRGSSPYRKENTTFHHYKDKLVNTV
jgi:hypothetical protein